VFSEMMAKAKGRRGPVRGQPKCHGHGWWRW